MVLDIQKSLCIGYSGLVGWELDSQVGKFSFYYFLWLTSFAEYWGNYYKCAYGLWLLHISGSTLIIRIGVRKIQLSHLVQNVYIMDILWWVLLTQFWASPLGHGASWKLAVTLSLVDYVVPDHTHFFNLAILPRITLYLQQNNAWYCWFGKITWMCAMLMRRMTLIPSYALSRGVSR